MHLLLESAKENRQPAALCGSPAAEEDMKDDEGS